MRPSNKSVGSVSSPLVELRNVTKTFRRGQRSVHALKDVSLTIPQGQFLALVGPSGSGKSTLLHLLAALDKPTSGSIRIGEWSLGTLDTVQRAQYRRSMVGLVFQQFHLVPTMSAQENVALPLLLAGVPPKERAQRAAALLDSVGLADRRSHRPTELSGGEQQRVATARALVGNPPLLLADEPTGNLDDETSARIVELLARVRRKQERTVVVATHHFAEVESVSERVIRLQDGTLDPATTEPG